MRVPLLDLSGQYHALAAPIRQQIDEVLQSQRFILGPKVEQFERALCDYIGTKFAIGVSSGTDALLAVLMALEIGPGDAVITTPYSFFATAACIARVGATPLFVDIEPETLNIASEAIRSFIKKNCHHANGVLMARDRQAIRLIIPVHLFGLCCEMDTIMEIAREHELLVIEDAAQAIGAGYPQAGGVTSAGGVGGIGCFCFFSFKKLWGAGGAGALLFFGGKFGTRVSNRPPTRQVQRLLISFF